MRDGRICRASKVSVISRCSRISRRSRVSKVCRVVSKTKPAETEAYHIMVVHLQHHPRSLWVLARKGKTLLPFGINGLLLHRLVVGVKGWEVGTSGL